MTGIFTCEQLRRIDAYTLERQGIRSIDLMERAALAFVEQFVQLFPVERPVVVFAGPGNNGGDALAISRLLAERNYGLEVYLLNTAARLSPDCAEERQRLIDAGSTHVDFHEVNKQLNVPRLTAETVVVDGIFGTGTNRPLTGGFAAIVQYINASLATVVAIDVPSGLMTECNDTNDLERILRAHHTITFQTPKLAFLFPEHERHVGQVHVVDIGLEVPAEKDMRTPYALTDAADIEALLPQLSRFTHKGQMGHALLVAGRAGVGGCAVLAARACLRSGVGKLTVESSEENRLLLQVGVPEAIVTTNPLERMAVEDYAAVGIGPGIGTDPAATNRLSGLLRGINIPTVLDADALTIIAQKPSLLNALPPDTVLTPHRAELERIVGKQKSSYALLQQAVHMARLRQLVILIKGAYSACVLPSGDVFFNPTGNAGMATAGSGDVLTGMVLGLLARGIPAAPALRIAVYVHGLAGDVAAEEGAMESIIASDLVDRLPQAFARGRGPG